MIMIKNTLTKKQRINQIFTTWRNNNPHPTTELEYTNDFELLLAVVLSAQATDVGVNKATRFLYPIANTPEQILALGEEKLLEYIKSIGLYRTKGKNIILLCKRLIDDFDSKVPQNFDDLVSLAGVGRKTANVILNTLYHQPTIAVDTHVFRVANRLKIAPGKTVEEVEKKLLKAISNEFILDAHHWIILHGRYVCKAQRPQCATCGVSEYCPSIIK